MSVGSINFIQSNSSAIQYLRGPQNSNLLLNSDFTIEFYIKCGTQTSPQDLKSLILSQYSAWGGSSNSYFIYIATGSLSPITIDISGGAQYL